MKEAAIERVEGLLTESSLTWDTFFWGVLAGILLFATAHLVTMLLTRWGDHKATSKSLVFSILVHVSCGLGMWGLSLHAEPVAEPEEEKPVPVRKLIVESEEQREPDEPGNTPVWDQLPTPPEMPLARLDRAPLELQPLESPERRPEPITAPEVALPDLPNLPDEPVVTPQPQEQADAGLRLEAAIPLKIDAPTPEARPDVEVPPAANPRQPLVRDDQVDTTVVREPRRGAVDRVRQERDTARELASLDAVADPGALLKRGPEDEVLRRREGPAPSTLPEDETGATAPETTEGTAGESPAAPPLATRRTRTPQSRDDGSLERLRAERTPRTPEPASESELAVRESVPVDIPRGGLTPNVVRPNFDAVRTRKDAELPSTYRLRSLARRKESARKFGGTDASERAVEMSLRWLALQQNSEGFWDAERHGAGLVKVDDQGVDRHNAGKHADSGLTGLAVLAFLGAGYTHEEGEYAEQVDRALRWLIDQQREDGSLAGQATHYERMYCHAMATFALAEAYGMQSDPTIDTRLREPLVQAVAYILDNQNPSDGGWRYVKNQQGDMSMFGWQLMALKSAEIAGIPIPDDARAKMIKFLRDRSLGERNGLAGYRLDMPPTPSMTAEALFSKQMLGIRRTNPASIEAVEYLMERQPKRSEWNLYYWYYGTLAMYQYGGEPWRNWNESLRDLLVAEQITTGENAGSWDPKGPWGAYGGRLYSTTLSTLCLEVYYRFLPLYQMGGRYDE